MGRLGAAARGRRCGEKVNKMSRWEVPFAVRMDMLLENGLIEEARQREMAWWHAAPEEWELHPGREAPPRLWFDSAAGFTIDQWGDVLTLTESVTLTPLDFPLSDSEDALRYLVRNALLPAGKTQGK